MLSTKPFSTSTMEIPLIRLNDYPKGVEPSGSKWGTLERDEDIV